MAKKPEPPKPTSWNVYKVAAKQTWVGEVEATDEREAIDEKAVTEFRHHAALPAEKMRDPVNREVIWCPISDAADVTPCAATATSWRSA